MCCRLNIKYTLHWWSLTGVINLADAVDAVDVGRLGPVPMASHLVPLLVRPHGVLVPVGDVGEGAENEEFYLIADPEVIA